MLMLTSRFSIEPNSRGAFMLFAKGMVQRTQKQTGCLGFGIFEDVTMPDTFIMLEQWASTQLFELHSTSSLFAHDDEVLMTFIIGTPQYDEYEFEDMPEVDE